MPPPLLYLTFSLLPAPTTDILDDYQQKLYFLLIQEQLKGRWKEGGWEGGRKNFKKRKGWIEGIDKHVQGKGAILKEKILNEGAVIGGTQLKINHSWCEGSIGPRLVG